MAIIEIAPMGSALPMMAAMVPTNSASRCRHEFPVDQGPEGFHVLRTQVAEIDVVGVLPQVDGQQRGGPGFGQRAAGVGGVDDGQGAVGFLHQPGPAGTEVADGRLGERILELGEGAECLVDGIGQGAGRLATAVRGEAVPVEGVVPDLGGVVEDTAVEVLMISSRDLPSNSVPGTRLFRLTT
jgi:hypothetical protein